MCRILLGVTVSYHELFAAKHLATLSAASMRSDERNEGTRNLRATHDRADMILTVGADFVAGAMVLYYLRRLTKKSSSRTRGTAGDERTRELATQRTSAATTNLGRSLNFS